MSRRAEANHLDASPPPSKSSGAAGGEERTRGPNSANTKSPQRPRPERIKTGRESHAPAKNVEEPVQVAQKPVDSSGPPKGAERSARASAHASSSHTPRLTPRPEAEPSSARSSRLPSRQPSFDLQREGTNASAVSSSKQSSPRREAIQTPEKRKKLSQSGATASTTTGTGSGSMSLATASGSVGVKSPGPKRPSGQQPAKQSSPRKSNSRLNGDLAPLQIFDQPPQPRSPARTPRSPAVTSPGRSRGEATDIAPTRVKSRDSQQVHGQEATRPTRTSNVLPTVKVPPEPHRPKVQHTPVPRVEDTQPTNVVLDMDGPASEDPSDTESETAVDVDTPRQQRGVAQAQAASGAAHCRSAPSPALVAPAVAAVQPKTSKQVAEPASTASASYTGSVASVTPSVTASHDTYGDEEAATGPDRPGDAEVAIPVRENVPVETAVAAAAEQTCQEERTGEEGEDDVEEATSGRGSNRSRHFKQCSVPEALYLTLVDVYHELKECFPYFILCQLAVTWTIWFIFNDSFGRGGLDGISSLTGKTELRFNRDCDDLRFQPWRLITYQFTHMGPAHAATNTMFLLLGLPIERRQGSLRTFLIFNCGVFGGACAFAIWDIHTAVIGMSAGCYGIFGAYVADVLIKRNCKDEQLFKMLVFFTLALATAVEYFSAPSERVSHAAHFGGTVAGMLSNISFGMALEEKSLRAQRFFSAVVAAIALAFAAFSLKWSTNWPPRNVWESRSWCWTGQVRDEAVFLDNDFHCVYCKDWPCVDQWYNQSEVSSAPRWRCFKEAQGW